jgi:hypothetical protein
MIGQILTGFRRYHGVCISQYSRCTLINTSLCILLSYSINSNPYGNNNNNNNNNNRSCHHISNNKPYMCLRLKFRYQCLVSDRHTTNFSNKTLGLDLSSRSCPRMEHPISPILQIGPTNLLEQDISCATSRDQHNVLAARSRHQCLESALRDLLMDWRVTAQHLQHLSRPQGHPLKAFPPVRHSRSASTDSSMATPETGSSQASATSPTSPAQAQSTPHCRQKNLFKKQTTRQITMHLSWPGITPAYTPNNQCHTKPSIQANYTATRTPQRAVPIKTSMRTMVSGQPRDRTGRRRHR